MKQTISKTEENKVSCKYTYFSAKVKEKKGKKEMNKYVGLLVILWFLCSISCSTVDLYSETCCFSVFILLTKAVLHLFSVFFFKLFYFFHSLFLCMSTAHGIL